MSTLREWKNGPAHRTARPAKAAVRSPFNARARRALPVLLQRPGFGRDRAIANVVLVAWDKPRLAQTTAANPKRTLIQAELRNASRMPAAFKFAIQERVNYVSRCAGSNDSCA